MQCNVLIGSTHYFNTLFSWSPLISQSDNLTQAILLTLFLNPNPNHLLTQTLSLTLTLSQSISLPHNLQPNPNPTGNPTLKLNQNCTPKLSSNCICIQHWNHNFRLSVSSYWTVAHLCRQSIVMRDESILCNCIVHCCKFWQLSGYFIFLLAACISELLNNTVVHLSRLKCVMTLCIWKQITW